MMRHHRASLLALSALLMVPMLALDGCAEGPKEPADEVRSETLATALYEAEDLSIVAEALRDTGLSSVFDGAPSYTLLAPRNAAFEARDDVQGRLASLEQRPQTAAFLRDHVLPGYITPEDIGNAIDKDADGRVALRTLGDHLLIFSRANGAIIVTTESGDQARITPGVLRAANGVAIRLDGLLENNPSNSI